MDRQQFEGTETALAPPGWYWAEGDPADTMRYWDGTLWLGDPQVVQPMVAEPIAAQPNRQASGGYVARQVQSAEQLERSARRQAIRAEQLRRTGVRLGEGIPFHEMYMRTRSRKGVWRS